MPSLISTITGAAQSYIELTWATQPDMSKERAIELANVVLLDFAVNAPGERGTFNYTDGQVVFGIFYNEPPMIEMCEQAKVQLRRLLKNRWVPVFRTSDKTSNAIVFKKRGRVASVKLHTGSTNVWLKDWTVS